MTTIKLEGVANYCNLETPRQHKDASGNDQGAPKYGLDVILDKDSDAQDIARLREAIEASDKAARASDPAGFRYKPGAFAEGYKCTFRDSDKRPDLEKYPYLAGTYTLKADSKFAVPCFSPEGTPLDDKSTIKSGDRVAVLIELSTYSTTFGSTPVTGTKMFLKAVKLLSKGEPLGGTGGGIDPMIDPFA